MKLKAKGTIWLEAVPGLQIGFGRKTLLQKINETGSIADAARAMKIYNTVLSGFENFQQTRYYYTANDSLTGISKVPDDAFRFKMFPIPAHESIQLTSQQNKSSNINLMICDLNGKILSSNNYSLKKGDNTLNLDIKNLSQGIYLIKAINKENNAQYINRFVKQ